MACGAAFVYGTLMADEVVKLLINRVPPSRPATLSGFRRYRVQGQLFPAIVPASPEDTVSGKVCVVVGGGALCACCVVGGAADVCQAGCVCAGPPLAPNEVLQAHIEISWLWQQHHRPPAWPR